MLSPVTSAAQSPQLALPGSPPPALTRGQIVVARVIGHLTENSIELEISGQRVRAFSPAPLRSGQTLKLRVLDTRSPMLLQPVTKQASSADLALRDTLVRLMPRQSTAEAFRGLNASLSHATRELRAPQTSIQLRPSAGTQLLASPDVLRLSPSEQKQLRSLARVIPSLPQLATAPGLKQAVEQFTVPLESRLKGYINNPSAASQLLENDWRAQLTKIAHALPAEFARTAPERTVPKTVQHVPSNSAPAVQREKTESQESVTRQQAELSPTRTAQALQARESMTKAIEAAIARLQVSQLINSPQSTGGGTAGPVEIPVFDQYGSSVIQLEYRTQEKPENAPPGKTEQTTQASMTVHIDIDTERTLGAKIRLGNGDISIVIGSDDPALHELVQRRIGTLVANLKNRALDPAQVTVAPVSPRNSHAVMRLPLIDENV